MDISSKINELCEMQACLMSATKAEISNGLAGVDSKTLGEAFDMIKDISQTEKYMRESKYYETVTKAMEDGNDIYGYTPRVSGNIRYGYKPMLDQEPYVKDYISDPNHFRAEMGSEYGNAYDRYKTAKKWYTKTDSNEYKTEMDEFSKEHLMNTVTTIKEMWHDASPELKQRMKTELTSLLNTMVQ